MGERILIVEDDEKIAATVELYLRRDGHEVTVVGNGRDALAEFRREPFALAVLDLMLPLLSGLELCRILRSESEVYVIMLTARTTEEDKLRGLNLGADDYVTKPFSPRELAARVRAVLRRRGRAGREEPSELRFKNVAVDVGRHEASVGGRPVSLTPAEFRLLEAFVRSPGRVFTREELVGRAFGHDYEGLGRTVDAHVMNLRRKIEPDRSNPSLIVTVYGVGYKLSAE